MANAASAITFAEKVAIRSVYCKLNLAHEKVTKKAVQDAITEVSGVNWDTDLNRHEKLAAALNFRRNLSGRGGRYTWVPSRFGCEIVRNAINDEQEGSVRRFLRARERNKIRIHSMQSYLPENSNSDSVVYELKDWPDPNVTVLIDAARETLRRHIYNASPSPQCDDVIVAFDRQCDARILPADVTLVVYEHDKDHGVAPHADLYATFGSVIFLVDETPELPLQVFNLRVPLPTNLTAKDCVVIDPTVVHTVPRGGRYRNRRSVVLNF